MSETDDRLGPLLRAARQAVSVCLSATSSDTATILFDDSTAAIARALRKAFEELDVPVLDANLDELGPRPLVALPRALLDGLERSSISVMAVRAVQGEFTLRRGVLESVATTGRRHVHMPSISSELFVDGLAMDYRAVAEFVAKVASRLCTAHRVQVTSPAGTQLDIELTKPPPLEILDGLILPGTWQNLPSGQVTTQPSSVRGVFVVDCSLGDWFQHKYDVAQSPVSIEFDGTRVRSVTCDDTRLLRDLRLFLGSSTHSARVSELAVGANRLLAGAHRGSLFEAYREGASLSVGTVVGTTPWASSTAVQLIGKHLSLSLDGEPLLADGRFVGLD